MRKLAWLLICAFLSLASTAVAQEQIIPSRPIISATQLPELSPAQQKELHKWLADMKSWQKYDEKWFNRIPKGNNGELIEKRKIAPAPPDWLGAMCQRPERLFFPEDIQKGCLLLAPNLEPIDPKAKEIATQVAQFRKDKEKLFKGSFLSRLHVDSLGSRPEFGDGPQVFGLIGSHLSLVDLGRLQFYGPPGVMLLSFPTASGKRELQIGYTWGMSYKLRDIHLPGFGSRGRNATIFINLTKCWVEAGVEGRFGSGMDFATFSISPKKKEQ